MAAVGRGFALGRGGGLGSAPDVHRVPSEPVGQRVGTVGEGDLSDEVRARTGQDRTAADVRP
eukprot:7673408-Pyramimonas_sp.AAC.1